MSLGRWLLKYEGHIMLSKPFQNFLNDLLFLDTQELFIVQKRVTELLENRHLTNEKVSKIQKTRSCNKCGSAFIRKHGKTISKAQRYYCLSCHKTFIYSKDHLLFSTKKSLLLWQEYLKYLLEDETIKAISSYLGLSVKTCYRWRMKLFYCLKDFQKSVVLDSPFYLDETYISIKDDLASFSSRNNLVVILVALDKKGHTIIKKIGRSKEKAKEIIKACNGHLQDEAVIIHDGNPAHQLLIEEYALKSKTYLASSLLAKEKLQPINILCAQIKRILFLHVGIKEEKLQLYLDWIVVKRFLNHKFKNIKDKVDYLLKYCIESGFNIKS
jgi:transposase-like protein